MDTNLQRVQNMKLWQDVQDEIRYSRQMFDYATDWEYIDIAIALENLALQKASQIKQKIMLEHETTEVTTSFYEKESKLKKLWRWLITPYVELYNDFINEKYEKIDLIKLEDITWVDMAKMQGRDVKPVADYKIILGGKQND